MTADEQPVTFGEARKHAEAQLARVKAYLASSVHQGHVAERELAEINRIGAAYQRRLGDQPDPWQQFVDLQSRLSRLALEKYGTAEGVRAYEAFLANDAHPRPVSEADSA